MYFVLLVVGLALTGAGFVTIGFGIPINAFSLGNTLIIAGTTAVVGGLIVIGLAAAVRQLNRVAQGLRALQRQSRPPESAETMAQPAVRQAPSPVVVPRPPAPDPALPRAAEPRAADPRLAEPRFPPAPPPAAGPLDWLRAKPKAKSDQESSMVELADEAPLSPRVPARNGTTPLANLAEPTIEPKVWSPSRDMGSRPDAPPDQIVRAGAQERPRDHGFDVAWPEVRTSRGGATEERESRVEVSRPRDHDRQRDVPLGLTTERAPAILKSGVIDGMPYTLYADGSIEAELPQGTVKFASVDALRTHLEKNG